MAEPLSPDHVFYFLADDPLLDLEDDPEEDHEEDPEMDIPPVAAPPVGSPPPISESSSDSDSAAPINADKTVWVPPSGSTFKIEGPSSVSLAPPHLLVHDMCNTPKMGRSGNMSGNV
ncbi:hypothetical protein Tco_1087310 [Tanacetum coccineum]